MDFDSAILAHSQWKRRLRDAIDKNESIDAAETANDDQCELGKWIRGDGGKTYGADPVFGQLRDDHAGFHRIAADVAESVNQGDRARVDEMLGVSGPFSKCSAKVVGAIITMRDRTATGDAT